MDPSRLALTGYWTSFDVVENENAEEKVRHSMKNVEGVNMYF